MQGVSEELVERWKVAQTGERAFHCDDMAYGCDLAARRGGEVVQRAMFAGLLGLGISTPESVTDFGCGPDSLMLVHPARGIMVAVDPLTFRPEDEARYAERNITRSIVPGEQHAGPQTEEVWMYNCLQHTLDPVLVVRTAARHAKKTVRIFEWTHVQTDTLHLHRITEAMIIRVLTEEGFTPWREAMGRLAVGGDYQRSTFYAGIWGRK